MKSRRNCLVMATAVVVLLSLQSTLNAQPMDAGQLRAVLVEAQRDYDRGIGLVRSDPAAARLAFQSAAERFKLAAEQGASGGVVHYNLGNTLLQTGDIGRAILNYRKAERLMPGDPRLQANLSYARTLVRSQIMPSGQRSLRSALLAWHHGTSPQTRWLVFALTYCLMWLMLLIRFWRASTTVNWIAILSGLAALGTGLSLLSDLYGFGQGAAGVVIEDNVIARKGNGAGYEPKFEQPLHSGVEFEVVESRGDWLQVRLPDEQTGWIEAKSVGLVDPLNLQ